MKINTNVSNAFYVLKGIAIIAVVYAHCVFENIVLQDLASVIGLIGVPIFLVASGIFFKPSISWQEFIYKTGKRLVVPWLIYGCATYLLFLLASKDVFSVVALIKWIMGYKTWLYYVPVLISCMLITRVFYKNRFFIVVSILANLLSIIATQLGILSYVKITAYQNPLNWIGFFALGMYLKKYEILQILPNKWKHYKLCLIGSGIIGGLLVCIGIFLNLYGLWEISYFNIISIFMELFIAFFLYLLSFCFMNSKLLLFIGKNSYPIYFLHMQIGMNIFEIIENKVGLNEVSIFIVKPIMIVLLISFGIYVFIRICKCIGIVKLLEVFAFTENRMDMGVNNK